MGLRLCSMAARGLWIEMMCIMHDGDPYGYLTIAGRPIAPSALAVLVGESADTVVDLLVELTEYDVVSADTDGALFSRRMVRDEALREARAAGGPAGADHGIKGASHGSKGGRPRKAKPPLPENGRGVSKPPPSSPSPSSPPSEEEEPKPDTRPTRGSPTRACTREPAREGGQP